jgi:formylglycine-generating enzyme required for sulfatase activity
MPETDITEIRAPRETFAIKRTPPRPNMVWVPGGIFLMGSNRHYPEEGPAHRVLVDGFWLDQYAVTNADFARFVDETGYVTTAERPARPEDYPGAEPELLVPGSAVFRKLAHPVDRRDCLQWWAYVPGACWRHPEGPGSGVDDRMDHPVVHVTYADVEAYALWVGKEIPSEAEWERAARGGLDGAEFCWGDDFSPGGRFMANTWQGAFPWQNLGSDGYEGTAPVGSFPPNGYGAYDMAGNVWEWTSDWFVARHPGGPVADQGCCVPRSSRGAEREDAIPLPRKVLKGGSFLCAPDYCMRYRPAARYPETVDTSTCHIGFRLLVRPLP